MINYKKAYNAALFDLLRVKMDRDWHRHRSEVAQGALRQIAAKGDEYSVEVANGILKLLELPKELNENS